MNPLLLAKLGAAVAAVVAVLWIAHELEVRGENKIRAEDTAAISEFQQRMARQFEADAATNTEATAGLKKENGGLRELLAPDPDRPVSPVRLCVPSSYRLVATPPGSAASGTERGAAAAGGVQQVPDGAGVGPDIGPSLQLIAAVADRQSALVRAWLVRERGLQKNQDIP